MCVLSRSTYLSVIYFFCIYGIHLKASSCVSMSHKDVYVLRRPDTPRGRVWLRSGSGEQMVIRHLQLDLLVWIKDIFWVFDRLCRQDVCILAKGLGCFNRRATTYRHKHLEHTHINV